MPDTAAADADRKPEADSTSAGRDPSGDASPAATETTSPITGGVGDMALQRKAEVGPADDPMEREADGIAQRLTRPIGPVPTPTSAEGSAEPIRRKAAPDSRASRADGGELPDSVRDYLATSKGAGAALPDATRRFFESRFDGVDFGAVRIHDDPGANEAARQIGAVAFTRGRDVYFAAGMYDPGTGAGRAILAHELTHVVQQGAAGRAPSTALEGAGDAGSAVTPDSPDVIRRTTDKKRKEAAGEKQPYAEGESGCIDLGAKTVHLKQIRMPAYKARFHDKRSIVNRVERKDGQVKVWEDAVASDVRTAVQNRISALTRGKVRQHNKAPTYFLQYGRGAAKRYVIGDVDAIAAAVRRPKWTQQGDIMAFDVDHKKEWQLGGTDEIDNFWLLFFRANRSAGSTIRWSIDAEIQDVIDETRAKLSDRPPSAETIKARWKVTGEPKGEGSQAFPDHWNLEDLRTAAFTDALTLVPEKKVKELKGAEDAVAVYSQLYGGAAKVVNPDKPSWGKAKSFQVSKVEAREGGGGKVIGTFYPAHERVEEGPLEADLTPIPGVEFGGQIDAGYSARRLLFKGLSPLAFDTTEFDPEKGLVARARIPTPSISILRNTEVGVRFEGPDVAAYALITADGIALPGPLQITGGALELAIGTRGFTVDGEMAFEIEKLGRGKLRGGGGSSESPSLSARLEVDSELFTKAEVIVHYRDGKWGGGGTLLVGPDAVKGIKSAEVTVDVSEERIEAKGSFESSLKGLEKGTLAVLYDKGKGLEVSGQLTLRKLPGIEGGTIDAKVEEGAEGYKLSGAVTARPSIPGVTGSVTGRFDDGAFLARADLGYQKGMLSGKVQLGLTNQAVTGGAPAGPPTHDLTAWGGGQVTIRIAPWLQGKIGLELDPQGRMTVRGEVALPDQLELFGEKKAGRNIRDVGLDIPIVGVSVLGQNIGIFATVGGGVDASACFGPGVLRGLKLAVTYSPDDEAATTVTGSAEVHVPTSAALKLYVTGSLGAGIPVVSARVGLTVSGALGLEGAATAGVNVDWSPSRGLVLDAKGAIFVEPKFRFAIDVFACVKADLWVDTITLYSKERNLGDVEYGSNIRFGVRFPVHYEEGKPFDVSLHDVDFVYPSIDPSSVLKGLVAQVL